MNASISRGIAALSRQARNPLAATRTSAAPAAQTLVRCMNRNARVPTASNGKTRPCSHFLRHAKTKHMKSRSMRPLKLYDKAVKIDKVNAGS